MFRLVFLLAVVCAAHAAVRDGGACDVDARMDISGKNPPVILVANGRSWALAGPTKRTPTNSFLSLGNQKLLIACPGNGNSLSVGGGEAVEATCVNSRGTNYFVINGRQVATDSVTCSRRVQTYELNTRQSCNGDGTILKLGFMVKGEHSELITTCHRLADGGSYYSTHILEGASLPTDGTGGKRSDDTGRPTFTSHNPDLFRGFPPKNAYNQANQLNALNGAMGSGPAGEVFDSHHNKFFAKGHLAPNADFMLDTSRDVTFSFVNVQPQWQLINGGHWSHLESTVRKSAAASSRTYFIATGTSGVLSPSGRKVFLDIPSQRVPIPDVYTKVVLDVKTNKCMAFVSNNFPTDSAPTQVCRNICAANNWPDFSSPKEGFIYCCSYNEFKTKFPKNAPPMDCSGGVLSF